MILYHGNIVEWTTLCVFLPLCLQVYGNNVQDGVTKDQLGTRTNTLFDDVDDTQRQLDNEVKERLSRPKTVWVIHIPTRFPILNPLDGDLSLPTTANNFLMRIRREDKSKKKIKDNNDDCSHMPDCHCNNEMEPPPSFQCSTQEWDYINQENWKEMYKSCGGRSQSPVDLPVNGLIRARGARKLLFKNYDRVTKNMTLVNDGKSVTIYGHWEREQWPLVYGGAAHSRRYLFHSLSLFWPSEHGVGGLHYPLESQVLHISAEYKTFKEAVAATNDPQAFLGIINIYKYGASTQKGTLELIKTAIKRGVGNITLAPMPLNAFSPPFKDYVCYQGSLTTPPCTESVLWLARRKSLPLKREEWFFNINRWTKNIGSSCTMSSNGGWAIKNVARLRLLFTNGRYQADDTIYETAAKMHLIMATAETGQKPLIRLPQPLNDRKVFLFT